MRLKFRAWDKRRKEFRNDVFIDLEGNLYEFSKKTGYGQAISYLNDEFIELMQYTGIEDENGKEIWEHDRVKIKGKKGEYGIGYCCGSFSAFKIDGRGAIDLIDLEKLHSEVEVIGTAYDPERPFNRVSL